MTRRIKTLFARGGVGRLLLLTWAGVYPILLAISLLMDPIAAALQPWARSFLTSVIMIPLMVLVIMPTLRRWMQPSMRGAFARIRCNFFCIEKRRRRRPEHLPPRGGSATR